MMRVQQGLQNLHKRRGNRDMSITGKLFAWVCAIVWLLFLIALGTTLVVLFLKYVGWVLSIVIPIIGGLGL